MVLMVDPCKNDIIRITIYYLNKLRKKFVMKKVCNEISLGHGMQPTTSQSLCLRFNLTTMSQFLCIMTQLLCYSFHHNYDEVDCKQ